jgi:hypothetical protein
MAYVIRTGKAAVLRYQAGKETQYQPHTMYRNRQVDYRLTRNMFCCSIQYSLGTFVQWFPTGSYDDIPLKPLLQWFPTGSYDDIP